MVEADSHLKLISTSTLHIYKEFEHIDMLCIDIQLEPYTVIPHLKLLPTSILHIYKVFEHIDMLSIGIHIQ
jgi:hypothetical protein